jgi:predicted negative regulator of RcsB-dependent stress response
MRRDVKMALGALIVILIVLAIAGWFGYENWTSAN